MRHVALGAVVLLVVGLAASKALAAGPHDRPQATPNVQLVGHPGPHGYHHGWYHPRPYGPPAVVVPVPAPVYVTPRAYYAYPYYSYPNYYYQPSTTFRYFGPGGGISIGW